MSTTTRTTEQIHKDIKRVITTKIENPAPWFAELAALWREMAQAAEREDAPRWSRLAAALLAENYAQLARQLSRS